MGDTGICAAFSGIAVAIGLHQPFARLAQLGFNQTKEIALSYHLYPQLNLFHTSQHALYHFCIIFLFICLILAMQFQDNVLQTHFIAGLFADKMSLISMNPYINKNKSISMPRYTIIEQPLEEEHHRPRRPQAQSEALYVQRLRQVLENNRRNNQYYTNQNIHRPIRLKEVSSQRYETEKSDNEQQIVYVVNDNMGSGVHLPKIRRRTKVIRNVKYADIDHNEKLIIRNYMNAKLIEFKNSSKKSPKKHKRRRNHTIDSVGELPDNSRKKYYKYHVSTPIENLQRNSEYYPYEGQSNQISSRTESINQHSKRHYNFNPNHQNTLSGIRQSMRTPASTVVRTQGDEMKRSIVNDFSDSNYNVKMVQPLALKLKEQEWEMIDPLSLETYFVKMKKVTGISPEQSKMEKTKNKIPRIPTREQMSGFIKNYVPEFDQIKIQELIKADSFQIIQDESGGQVTFYFGETLNDKKNGKGVFIAADKLLFEGIWANDSKIRGIEVTELGKYKGDFKDGIRSGKGQFFWSHGEYYSGEWKNGKKNGSGYWKSLKGQSYMGEWKNGQVTGYGVHTMKTGQKYQGQFVNFLKHGFGKEAFPNGDGYEGRYVQGQPHGKGKYTWKNGIIFEGEFIEGYRNGKGVITAPNHIKFEGTFKDEIITGLGRLESSKGDIFNGMFENNKKNGHGILDMKSQKRIIKGFWENNELVREEP